MGFIIGNVISVCKTFISGVSKEAILALSGLVAWVLDEDEGFGNDYAGDTVGDERRTIQAGRCYLFDGVDDYVDCGNIGNVTSVSFYIKSVVDNQEIMTLDGANSGRIYVTGGVLSFGGSLSGSNITVDGVSKTASEAGALINDNLWHLVAFDIVSFSASSLYLGRDASAYGNINLRDVKFNDGDLAHYKGEEGAETTCYDSSGNVNHGTITNATLSTFHAQDTGVTYSYANEVGYSDGNQLIPPASAFFDTDGTSYWSTNRSVISYNSSDKTMVVTADTAGSNFGVFKSSILTSGNTYSVKFRAKSPNYAKDFQSIGNNADLGTVISNPILTTDWQNYEFIIVANQANMRIYVDAPASIGSEFEIDDIYVVDISSGLIPRDESDITKDVRGCDLDYSGRVKYDFNLVKSNCLTFDGTDDYVDFGSVGNVSSFSGWVKLAIDNQEIFTLNSATGGAITVSSGVLTAGGDIMINSITVDSVSKTASEAGALLNDNEWHYLAFNITDGINAYFNSTGLELGTDGSAFGQIQLAGLDFGQVTCPLAEGAGAKVYDVSGNDNHGTMTNFTLANAWGTTQDVYHYNIKNGFEHYDDDATGLDILRVPYKSDGTQITPTISGYTKNSNNPSGAYHNDSETQLNAPESPAMRVANNNEGNDFLFVDTTLNNAQDISYTDIDDDINNTQYFFADISEANKKKNLLIFDEQKSGSDLTKIQTYLNH